MQVPAGEDIQLRFRHTAGDIGPLKVGSHASIGYVKEQLIAAWPSDAQWQKEAPGSAADVKLILGGKFLDNSAVLDDLRPSMGELRSDTMVTMHAIVRPGTPAGKPAGKGPSKKAADTGCRCCIQ